jgi:hypothetical protein
MFSRDSRRTDSDAESTFQIFGYQITKKVDLVVGDTDQFLVVIKQSTEFCRGDRSQIPNLGTGGLWSQPIECGQFPSCAK